MDSLAPLAQYYFFFYWFIVLLMTVYRFNKLRSLKEDAVIDQRFDYTPVLYFSVFFILFFGLRPVIEGVGPYFGDTRNYAETYELLKRFGVYNASGAEDVEKDWLFFAIQKFCAKTIDVHLWFLLMMACYIIPMYVGCKKVDINHGALLMLFCIGSFQFYPFAVNGVRNGIACSIVILAVAFLCEKKILLATFFSFLALGFHKSAALPIVTMFFSYFFNKPRYMFVSWFGAIGVSLIFGELIDTVLSLLSFDERLASELQSDDADGLILEHRFRWDFLLYSSMPIILAAYTIFKRKLYNKTYLLLLGTYMYANSFWVLAIRAMFSNRIAYLSWFLYPIVLAYPLLNFEVFQKKHSQKAAWILLGHFGFTTVLWLMGK